MLGATMHSRALALVLAWLLLLSQQFGVQHALSHGRTLGPGGGAAGASVVAAADTGLSMAPGLALPGGDKPPADGLCAVCLLLATLGAAAVAAVLRCWLAGQRCSAPAWRAQPAAASRRAAHYRARAPPAAFALS